MSITMVDNSKITEVTAGNSEIKVCNPRAKRRGLIFTAIAGNVWIKFYPKADEDPDVDNLREGFLIIAGQQPFRLTSGVVNYGFIYCVNAVVDEAPSLHVMELYED